MLRTLLRFTLAPAIALLCAGTIAQLQIARMTATETRLNEGFSKAEYLEEEAQYRTTLAILDQLPSSSFDNLIADIAFLNFVQYFGDDEGRAQTGYSATTDFFKVAVKRDPLFLDMYPYLSATVTLYGGQPQTAVSLLDHGINVMPTSLQDDAYFMGQFKGTDELLFLGQPQQARQSYELAAQWASQSEQSDIRTIGQRAQQTARFLATNPNSQIAQVAAWSDILTRAIDQPTRQLAHQQIEKLGGRVTIGENGILHVQLPQQ